MSPLYREGVRCVKGYSVVVLTGTDAREYLAGGRPLCQRLQRRGINGDGRTRVSSGRASVVSKVTAS